ncbi:ALP1-like protein [Tanacetum coccineum]
MNRSQFTRIVRDLSANCPYFQEGCDAVGKAGISALVKVIDVIWRGVLRRPTQTDVEKLYAFHENKHGFPGMIGSIDCTKWLWAQCPQAYRAQFSRGDSGSEPFILLEAVASQDLWIWHAFFVGKSTEGSISRYVELLQRSRSLKRITHLMYTCIILHNMIRKEKGKAISPDFYPEEQHREDDPVRSAQDRLRVIREIHDEETHLNLKADLVEHILVNRTNAN